jgi:hypothetical protein
MYRTADENLEHQTGWTEVGQVKRDAFDIGKTVVTDAEAIRVEDPGIVPQGIYAWYGKVIPTWNVAKARIGDRVCYSGVKSGIGCGQVVHRSVHWYGPDGFIRGGYWVEFEENQPTEGDSGAPVWKISTANGEWSPIGLITAYRANGRESLVEPLLHPYHMPAGVVPGILGDPVMGALSLKHR